MRCLFAECQLVSTLPPTMEGQAPTALSLLGLPMPPPFASEPRKKRCQAPKLTLFSAEFQGTTQPRCVQMLFTP